MRLTTLARKIKITPSKLIDFLIEHDFQVDNGVNTKLNDETVLFIKSHFEIETDIDLLPEQETDNDAKANVAEKPENTPELPELRNEKTEISDTVIPIEPKPKHEERKDSPKLPKKPKAGTIEDLEEGKADDIDLIKVKKVKLEGIKVVGKIELPEKKKKEEPKKEEDNANVETTVKTKKEFRTKGAGRPRKKYQKGRNNRKPLSYEEKLRREERNKKRQLQEKLKKEKERKKAHYEQTVKAKIASKPQKKKKKKESLQHAKSQEIVIYKNPIKRFWAWLNGKYDKY